ncbi:hypothetical protein AMTR_s00049p00069770 [Amborella trichopoda]|uniref:Uncharacterized protein n=1 Tax=Amborella trichopoda TaxID=13333 RepID=W1PZ21_AMBTC|nr:hypothetical protein AMTR_s00049p00069770 [Amborella trichopoda]
MCSCQKGLSSTTGGLDSQSVRMLEPRVFEDQRDSKVLENSYVIGSTLRIPTPMRRIILAFALCTLLKMQNSGGQGPLNAQGEHVGGIGTRYERSIPGRQCNLGGL